MFYRFACSTSRRCEGRNAHSHVDSATGSSCYPNNLAASVAVIYCDVDSCVLCTMDEGSWINCLT